MSSIHQVFKQKMSQAIKDKKDELLQLWSKVAAVDYLRPAQKEYTIYINNRYRLQDRIGEGDYGLFYKGWDEELGVAVGVKLEGLHNVFPVLRHETKCLKELQGLRGVPQIYW